MKGIEPPCAAWEAAVLPLNYTREEIFDFRFAIADCNRNKFALQIAVACAVLSASSRRRMRESAEDSGRYSTQTLQQSLPRNHVVGRSASIFVALDQPLPDLIRAQATRRSLRCASVGRPRHSEYKDW